MTENDLGSDKSTSNLPNQTTNESPSVAQPDVPSQSETLPNENPITNNSEGALNASTGTEMCNLEVLRRIELRRQINLSDIDFNIRDPATLRIVKIGNDLKLCDDTICLAIKIFDFNLFKNPELSEQIDLLSATSLLMAAKVEDVKRSDLCVSICSMMPNIHESEVLKFELQALVHLKYDVVFATASQFLWHQLKTIYNENNSNLNETSNEMTSNHVIQNFESISQFARIACLCSMAYSKCLSFSGENVASECVKIALELAEKGKEIDVITTAGDGGLRDIIVEAMKKANEGIEGGIFDGLSEPLEDTS